MLTEIDIERFDSIMESVLQLREERGYVPPRDEEKIAEILQKWEKSSVEEHKLLVESIQYFASTVRYQPAARNSNSLKQFPQIG
jgi:NADH:ubiquinone oxidoreductase subunit E